MDDERLFKKLRDLEALFAGATKPRKVETKS
jgi:hypothetical protein